MKSALIAALSFVAAAALPQAAAHAQIYQQAPGPQGPSVIIPVPGTGPDRREQQAQLHDQRCAELDARQRELRDRADDARDPEERARVMDRLADTRDQLRDECR